MSVYDFMESMVKNIKLCISESICQSLNWKKSLTESTLKRDPIGELTLLRNYNKSFLKLA